MLRRYEGPSAAARLKGEKLALLDGQAARLALTWLGQARRLGEVYDEAERMTGQRRLGLAWLPVDLPLPCSLQAVLAPKKLPLLSSFFGASQPRAMLQRTGLLDELVMPRQAAPLGLVLHWDRQLVCLHTVSTPAWESVSLCFSGAPTYCIEPFRQFVTRAR
jgi:hypothetical protein